MSSRHLDGRLVSERRTHSTATGHSPIDANAHRTRRSSNSVNGSFFWRDPSRVFRARPEVQKILCRAAGSIDSGSRLRKPEQRRTPLPLTAPWRWELEKSGPAQAVLHVLRSDCQQTSAQPSERNAS